MTIERLEEVREEILTGLRKCPKCNGTGKIDEVECKRCNGMRRVKIQSIEIDCPPGAPRPGDLIDSVIEGTELPKRETVSRVFGNWEWDYTDIDSEVWQKANSIISERLKKLYNNGIIRYASW